MTRMSIKTYLRTSILFHVVVIFLLALALRLFYLHEIRDNPFFHNLTLDQTAYDSWAQSISAGNWLGTDIFYQDPLYPYFLGAIYSVIGRDLFWVRVIQAVIGSLTCVLIFMLGDWLYNRKAGLLAGAIAASYRPFLYFDAMILKTVLGVFLICLFLVLLLVTRPRRSLLLWLLAGVTLGLSALVRANTLLLAGGVIAWLFLVPNEGETIKQKTIATASFLLGLFLIVSIVCARNYIVGKDFVLLTSQAGQNFYIGNNPANTTGRYNPPLFIRPNPRFEQEDFRVRAEVKTGKKMKPSEISDYWFRESFKFIEEHPSRWLKLLGKKFWRFWNWYEVPDNQNYQFFKRYALLLRLPLPDFRMVAAVALTGFLLFLPLWRKLFLLYMTALLYSGTVIAFYIFSRYRLPVVPILILFASFAIFEIIGMARQKRMKRLAVFSGIFLLFWILLGTHVDPNEYYGDDSNSYCRLAAAYEMDGNEDAAAQAYQRATEILPHYWASYYGLAQICLRKGQLDLALKNYLLARTYSPKNPDILERLGYIYYRKSDFENSVKYFEAATRVKPDWDKPHFWLATIFTQQGKTEQAEAHLRKLKELKMTAADAN